jgi:isopentenyl-diphosphate Delta-isomerase
MTTEHVVLVDDHDVAIGVAEKLAAHRAGQLHRAVSVFLFDARGAMWLQRRALHKYHSPGLWTNACCTHPRPGEGNAHAATRRVREELGSACQRLRSLFSFLYYAPFDNGLVEHEYDHVFVGQLNVHPTPNPEEVDAVRLVPVRELRREVDAHPERFTAWFRIALAPVLRARDWRRRSARPDRYARGDAPVASSLETEARLYAIDPRLASLRRHVAVLDARPGNVLSHNDVGPVDR